MTPGATISSAREQRPDARFLFIAAVVLSLGYLLLGWIGSRDGIGAPDANAVIRVVNDQVQAGGVEVSRPPGHPLSENWILPAVARLTGGSAPALSPLIYGLYQMAGGVLCLVLFYFLLDEFGVPLARRLLAGACLAFSPLFLITSSDGEEFLWGMGCVLAAILMLSKLSSHPGRHPIRAWGLAVAMAVAATGYRLEYGAITLLVVFGTLLFFRLTWLEKFVLAAGGVLFLAALWSPVLLHQGAVPAYPLPSDLIKSRLFIALYKIAFHAMGLLPGIFACVFLFQSWSNFSLEPSVSKMIARWRLPMLIVLFFGVFFLYPTKAVEMIPGVAFLILFGAIHARPWAWTCFVITCMALLLGHLDCISGRQMTGLRIQPSLWMQSLAEKPASAGPKTSAATQLASTGAHVIVTNLWPWSLAWQKEHAGWPGLPEGRSGAGATEAYKVGPGIVASRDVLDDPARLEHYVSTGYDIWVDKDLYRDTFLRYNVSAPTPSDAVIGNISCKIIDLK